MRVQAGTIAKRPTLHEDHLSVYVDTVSKAQRDQHGRRFGHFDPISRTIVASDEYTFTSGRTIRMLRDQVLIRLLHPERMTASKLLWIPDNAQRPESELYQGIVLAVGPGKDYGHGRLLPDVRPGDRCVFYWGAGEIAVDRLYDDSEELRILAEGSIQGVWR